MDALWQNVGLLISIALLPTVVLMLIFLFVKKIWKMAYVTLAALATVACLTCAVIGTVQLFDSGPVSVEEEEEAVAPTKEEFLEVAYAFLRLGDTESVERVVIEYADEYGYDDACTLLMSRAAAFDGQYNTAYGLYRKLYKDDLPEEAQAVAKIMVYNRQDIVLAEPLQKAGFQQMAMNTAKDVVALENGGLRDLITAALDKEGLGQNSLKGAEWVKKATATYEQYMRTGQADDQSVQNLLSTLSDIEDDGLYNKLEVFREARLKTQLLGGKFDSVLDDLDDYTGCAEWMLTLDLYLNKKVDDDAVASALRLESVEGIGKVLRHLNELQRNTKKKLSGDEVSKIEDQISRLEAYENNKVLYTIESALKKHAEDERNYKHASKIYLSLAKIAARADKDVLRNQYFSDALVTAPDSDDAKYSQAMNELANTITGGDTAGEAIMDIPYNATQAVQNSYYLPGVGEIIRNEEEEAALVEDVQDYTVKASAAVTINSVDPSNFETVVVKAQLSDQFMTEHEIMNLVRLTDCNYDIENYTIEKVEYEKANIILCCDNSGSMSGSIGSLKNAVSKFVESSHEKETLGFYTFDDYMIQSHPLGTLDAESMQQAIDSMRDSGGTNIFGSLTTILSSVSYDDTANQAIILMTDGQDGGNHDYAEIEQKIGNVAQEKGYIVYVLGMGSNINTTYLSNIAMSTGGQFVYSPSDAQLESLYEFIHGALLNQYKITFTAKDTLTSTGREVTVALDQKNVSDTAIYSVSNEDAENAVIPFDEGVSVYGLSKKLIYKQKNITNIDVRGTGFTSSDSMTVTLLGERQYTLRATYISDNTFRISVPADVAVGEYDVEVTLNRRKAKFLRELMVADGEPIAVKFGGYVFTAHKIDEYDDRIEMSGYVTMNDWLHFNGPITLRGKVTDASATLVDSYGSYVDYADAFAAQGYAKYLGDKGVALGIPSLGELKIFNAAEAYATYPVSDQVVPAFKMLELVNFYHPVLRLYPDRVQMEISKGELQLPFQDLVMTALSDEQSLFSVDFNVSGTISSNNVWIEGEASANYEDDSPAMAVLLMDKKADLSKTAFGFKFNTLTETYGVEFGVRLPWCVIDTYLGASLQWVDRKLDGVQLNLDRDFTHSFGGVPVTFSDFSLGVEGMATEYASMTAQDVKDFKLTGSMAASAYKVSAVVPKLKKYVGDMSLISVDPVQFECHLNKFCIQGSAEIKLLDFFTVQKNTISMGNFSYDNALLGLNNEAVTGVLLTNETGISFEAHNLKMDIGKSRKEISFTNRFVGLRYSGTTNMEMNWWIFNKKFSTNADALVGFYTDHSNNVQFTVRAASNDNGKKKGMIFFISSTGKMDYDLNYKY